MNANVSDRRPAWVKAMDLACSCSRDPSGRFILQANELCGFHEPKALRRNQIERRRYEFAERLRILKADLALLPPKIASVQRRLDELNTELRELGE